MTLATGIYIAFSVVAMAIMLAGVVGYEFRNSILSAVFFQAITAAVLIIGLDFIVSLFP